MEKMSKRFFVPMIVCVSSIFIVSHGSKILVYPHDLQKNAQFYSLVKIAEILAEKHEVTLLVNSLAAPPSSLNNNVTVVEYHLSDSTALPETGVELRMPDVGSSSVHLMRTERLQAMLDICEALFKRNYLMIKLDLQEFDLVFADIDNICARVLIDYLKVPSIIWCYDNYDASCDFSNDVIAMATSQDILSRFLHTCKYIMYVHLYQSSVIFQPFDKLRSQYSYNSRLSVSDTLSRNKPLVILNADFSVDMPRPIMPYVIPIAGLVFSKTNDLPRDVEDFIESSGDHSCIYVDLITKGSWLLRNQITTILDFLAKVQRCVIVEEGMNLNMHFSGKSKTVSSHFHSAVLNHEKVKLAITGCNHRAIHEMIYYKVPVIFLSSFGDNTDYCRSLLERHEVGKVIDILELSTLELEKEIASALDNIRCEKTMEKLSNVVRHQISNSKERLLHWVEFVSLNQGSENLYKSAALHLQWYQYGMLDILIFVLIGTMIIIFVCFEVTCFIIKWILRKVFETKQCQLHKVNRKQ